MQPQMHGRSCRTSSILQHHAPGGAPATVICSYIVGWRILGWGNLVHDTTTTMPGPCSEKSASPREGRGHWRSRHPAVSNTWAGWGLIVVFLGFFLGWQVIRVSPYVQRPFPSRRISKYWKGMISARPLYRESGSLVCVAERHATRSNGEWGYKLALAVRCSAPSAQRRCRPTGRCAYRLSVIYRFNKLLSLSHTHTLSLSLNHCCTTEEQQASFSRSQDRNLVPGNYAIRQ